MTDLIFFDTDCISAFLWVNGESLIAKMYGSQIVIPEAVYEELSNPRVSHLKERIDHLVTDGIARIMSIDITTTEYELYRAMTKGYQKGWKIIGKGEAASISLAKKYGGILASNNLSDINVYIEKFSLKHKTTGDILVDAYVKKLITEEEGNRIWLDMLRKRRKLGADSFTKYLEMKRESV